MYLVQIQENNRKATDLAHTLLKQPLQALLQREVSWREPRLSTDGRPRACAGTGAPRSMQPCVAARGTAVCRASRCGASRWGPPFLPQCRPPTARVQKGRLLWSLMGSFPPPPPPCTSVFLSIRISLFLVNSYFPGKNLVLINVKNFSGSSLTTRQLQAAGLCRLAFSGAAAVSGSEVPGRVMVLGSVVQAGPCGAHFFSVDSAAAFKHSCETPRFQERRRSQPKARSPRSPCVLQRQRRVGPSWFVLEKAAHALSSAHSCVPVRGPCWPHAPEPAV